MPVWAMAGTGTPANLNMSGHEYSDGLVVVPQLFLDRPCATLLLSKRSCSVPRFFIVQAGTGPGSLDG